MAPIWRNAYGQVMARRNHFFRCTRLARAIGVLALLSATTGCASPWQRHFVGAPADAALVRINPEAIEIREVPWQRVDATLAALNGDVAASDVHPDEWPVERQETARAQLLRGLQVSEDPTRVLILGNARFRTTESLTATDGDLARHAAKLGATRVVFSRIDTGVADRVVSAPVTTFGRTSVPYDRHGSSRWLSWDDGTAWVPVVVRARETGWMLFWLRVD